MRAIVIIITALALWSTAALGGSVAQCFKAPTIEQMLEVTYPGIESHVLTKEQFTTFRSFSMVKLSGDELISARETWTHITQVRWHWVSGLSYCVPPDEGEGDCVSVPMVLISAYVEDGCAIRPRYNPVEDFIAATGIEIGP